MILVDAVMAARLTVSPQTQWVSRTVMVQDNNIDDAMKILNGIMSREGMLKR